MLYRGQIYGAPVGEWWTTSKGDAEKFGMAAGGNRSWVVLAFDEDLTEPWLRPYLYVARDAGDERGSWYHIPIVELERRWRGVRVIDGAIPTIPETTQRVQVIDGAILTIPETAQRVQVLDGAFPISETA